jgi:hypothetical protein
MTGTDDTRLAEVQMLVEEALVVVERQRMVVLELQRDGQDAAEAKRLLLHCIEILTHNQEELARIRQAATP